MADAEPPPYLAYYETTQLYSVGFTGSLQRAELAKELRQRRLFLTLRTPSGSETEIRASSSVLEDETALMAVAFLRNAERGAEYDAVVAGDANELLIASFWWEPHRLVVAQRHHTGYALGQSGPGALLRPDGPSEEVLHERYRVGRLVSEDRRWDPVSRGFVEEAYQAMSEPEREILSYLPLHRVSSAVSAGGEQRVAARYFPGEEARIELYDAAVADSPTFVGDPDAPQPRSLLVLMHELGHGLMFAPKRMAYTLLGEIRTGEALDQAMLGSLQEQAPTAETQSKLEKLRARLAARERAAVAVSAWMGPNPVLDAYQAAVGEELAPTKYGRTSGTEAFAESFALWHLDRPALLRASPRAAAFFDKGEHVRVVQEAILAVQDLASPGL